MKSTTYVSTNSKILFILSGLVGIIFFSACSKKINFLTSSVVPAARGYVKVKKDSNKNYNIKLSVNDLAEVNRLDPPKETYVLWMLTNEGNTKNLGRINSSKNFLSNKLKASLETVSTFHPVQFFVTAENDAEIQYPGMQYILSTSNFK